MKKVFSFKKRNLLFIAMCNWESFANYMQLWLELRVRRRVKNSFCFEFQIAHKGLRVIKIVCELMWIEVGCV